MQQWNRRRVGLAVLVLVGIALVVIVAEAVGRAPAISTKPAQRTLVVRGFVFLRSATQTAELWLADPDGQNARKLADEVTSYSASPDGTQIAFMAQPQGQPSKIALIDLNTNKVTPIVWEQDFMVFGPAWSPDPQHAVIAYERREIIPGEPDLGAPKLWLVQADGTSAGPLVDGPDVVSWGASWSPDGQQLVFSDPRNNTLVLYDVRSQQTRNLDINGEVDWSPDGTQLVVSAGRPGRDYDNRLVIYDLARATQREVFTVDGSNDYSPRWSPNGQQIAFVRRTRENPYGTLWLGSLDTNTAVPVSVASPTRVDDHDPAWSPDGKTLTWTRLVLDDSRQPAALWRVQPGTSQPELWLENALQGHWLVDFTRQ